MCLAINKSSLPQYANDDIAVYKIIMEYDNRKGTFRGPFREEYVYTLNEPIHSRFSRRTMKASITLLPLDKIDTGLHSFKYKKDAEAAAKNLYQFDSNGIRLESRNYYVVKGRIPKGATYFEGTFHQYPSYASNTLIIDHGKLSWWKRFKAKLTKFVCKYS